MPLRDILVHLDPTPQAAARLAIAAGLARRHGAHLTGLMVVDVPFPAMAGDPSAAAVVAELMDSMRRDRLAEAVAVEARFREVLRREELPGEWRLAEGLSPEQVATHARYADLAVLGQEDPEGSQPSATPILQAALFTSGRPVLVVPYAGDFARPGSRVLVAWNATREAARAVADALPLMAGAESVTVLTVNAAPGRDGHGAEPGADIARYLARHGLPVTVEAAVAEDVAAGDVILNRAAELGADLLVMGAYGHSRLRELVLGGVTRTLFRQMTAPVLMAH